MRYPLVSKHYRRFPWLLLTACLSITLLTGAGAPPQADQREESREQFVKLDSEIQAIKEEILSINSEILLLQEETAPPGMQPLIILVSMVAGSPMAPGSISLQLDGEMLSQHSYTGSENRALREGGVHRIYSGRLSEGQHELLVTVTGRTDRDKDFRRQQSSSFSVSDGRQYLELELGASVKKSKTGVAIRHWQQ